MDKRDVFARQGLMVTGFETAAAEDFKKTICRSRFPFSTCTWEVLKLLLKPQTRSNHSRIAGTSRIDSIDQGLSHTTATLCERSGGSGHGKEPTFSPHGQEDVQPRSETRDHCDLPSAQRA